MMWRSAKHDSRDKDNEKEIGQVKRFGQEVQRVFGAWCCISSFAVAWHDDPASRPLHLVCCHPHAIYLSADPFS